MDVRFICFQKTAAVINRSSSHCYFRTETFSWDWFIMYAVSQTHPHLKMRTRWICDIYYIYSVKCSLRGTKFRALKTMDMWFTLHITIILSKSVKMQLFLKTLGMFVVPKVCERSSEREKVQFKHLLRH